jgi:hypothetical protein
MRSVQIHIVDVVSSAFCDSLNNIIFEPLSRTV